MLLRYPGSGCATGGGPFAFTGLGGGNWVGVNGFMEGYVMVRVLELGISKGQLADWTIIMAV